MPSNYWLCLDGGGKWRQQKYISFCGYLDTVDRFAQFTERWRSLLTAHGLKSLHMVDAMNWDGDWKRLAREWGDGRESRRQGVLESFIDVIKSQPTMTSVGFCADSRHVSVKAGNAKRPELMLFEQVITSVILHVPPDDKLSILCDWEDGFDEVCCRLLRKLRLSNPQAAKVCLLGFGDDAAYAELQAADLFAYLACKELERGAHRSHESQDPLYMRLNANVVTSAVPVRIVALFDAETLRRMIESQR